MIHLARWLVRRALTLTDAADHQAMYPHLHRAERNLSAAIEARGR